MSYDYGSRTPMSIFQNNCEEAALEHARTVDKSKIQNNLLLYTFDYEGQSLFLILELDEKVGYLTRWRIPTQL